MEVGPVNAYRPFRVVLVNAGELRAARRKLRDIQMRLFYLQLEGGPPTLAVPGTAGRYLLSGPRL